MSTTELEPTTAQFATEPADARTYRGRTLEELLPKIRDELGPEAIVVRQRDGLMGGIGGFFQQQFVEVEALPGRPRIDVHDEPPVGAEEGFAALLAAAAELPLPVEPEPVVEAPPSPVEPELTVEPAPAPPAPVEPEPEAHAPRAPEVRVAPADTDLTSSPPLPRAAPERLLAALIARGMSEPFAERLLADASAHELPFVPGRDLRAAVVRALARRLPVPLPRNSGDLAIAFAGAGSTRCADALTMAYVQAGIRARAVSTFEQARTRLVGGAGYAVVVLDVPPLDMADAEQRAHVAAQLGELGLDEVQIVLPTTLDLAGAQALHAALAPLAPTGFTIADGGPSDRIGAPLELACTTRLPLAYVLGADGAIAPADPLALARELLP